MALRVREPLDRRHRSRRATDRRRRDRSPQLAAFGFLGGLAAGVLLVSQQVHQHRRNLFSPHAYRRLLALTALRGQRSIETLRLLQDYVAWEPRPLLRRRGLHMLRQLERTYD